MPRTLLFLTGAQGSGKSTAIDWIVDQGLATRLKPFTTRAPRGDKDDEYHFYSAEEPPAQSEIAWSIERSNATYGMLLSELDRADAGDIAVTVFDPGHLNTLSKFRESTHHEVIVIGLDTVDTIEEQKRRTGNDQSRSTTPEALAALRADLRKLDVCLSGDAEVVRNALRAICQILTSRGGILPREFLMPLMHAGSALSSWEEAQVQPSSYDLRVGDEIWCQGKFHQLNADNPIFSKGGQLAEQLRQEFDKELTSTRAHVTSIGAAVFALFAFVLWGLTTAWGVVKDAHQATLDVREALEDLGEETGEEPTEPASPGPAIEPERAKQR